MRRGGLRTLVPAVALGALVGALVGVLGGLPFVEPSVTEVETTNPIERPNVAEPAPEEHLRPDVVLQEVVPGDIATAPAVVEPPPATTPIGDSPIVAPPTFDGPAVDATPAVEFTTPAQSTTAPDIFAVVVGINDYPGANADLLHAVNDANDVLAALSRFGVPGSNVIYLQDTDATAQTVLDAADWLTANAGPDDTALFFYAGHVRKVLPGVEALVTAEAGAVTDGMLARHLAGLQAQHTWIVMAACYGAGFDELLAPGRVLTAAADADSLAYENDDFMRSYLGEYLIRRGLVQGRGGATVQQAVAYAQRELADDFPERNLVQLDNSNGPIRLDIMRRGSAPAPVEPDPGDPGDGGSGGVISAPPPPPPKPPCKNLLGLFCPAA